MDGALLIEVNALKEFRPVHFPQVRTYVRIAEIPVAFLLNFGAGSLRDGYERFVHPRFAFLPPSRRELGAAGTAGDSGAAGVSPGGPEPSSR